MVLFVGQIARDHRDREAFQEVDYRASLARWRNGWPRSTRPNGCRNTSTARSMWPCRAGPARWCWRCPRICCRACRADCAASLRADGNVAASPDWQIDAVLSSSIWRRPSARWSLSGGPDWSADGGGGDLRGLCRRARPAGRGALPAAGLSRQSLTKLRRRSGCRHEPGAGQAAAGGRYAAGAGLAAGRHRDRRIRADSTRAAPGQSDRACPSRPRPAGIGLSHRHGDHGACGRGCRGNSPSPEWR